jgi:hypothetical protein
MRKRVTAIVFLGSLAATAAAQPGAEITMPPNSRQMGQFPFANNCPTSQRFQVSAAPPAPWLRFEPSTIIVAPGTSFAVQVLVNTSSLHTLGAYRTSLRVVCSSCAGADQPCLQDAKEFPIELTVADVKSPGEFEPTAAPAPPQPAKPEISAPRPVALISPEPPRFTHLPVLAVVGFGLLAAGLITLLLAVRGLSSRAGPAGAARTAGGDMRPESERRELQG